MDEQTLQVFLTLADTENTRDAAALLRVNQSNVSRALARLEAELGAELFTRRGRRVELNRAGEVFRADALRLREGFETGRRHVRQLTGPLATVRLGFLQSAALWAVPRLVGSFRSGAPECRFELRQGFARDLYGWIATDALDVAFVTAPGPRASASAGGSWSSSASRSRCPAVTGSLVWRACPRPTSTGRTSSRSPTAPSCAR